MDPPSDRIAQMVSRFLHERRSNPKTSIHEIVRACGDPDGSGPSLPNEPDLVQQVARSVRADRTRAGSSETVASETLAGRVADTELPSIEGYQIIDRIGMGAMGIVYEAYQEGTARRVAVKFLRDEATSTPASRQRFEREVLLESRLSHPNIVRVLDSGIHRGRYFYVMDYIEGPPLDEYVLASVPSPDRDRPHSKHDRRRIEHILRLMIDVCKAVEYAHERGVLHRDLKPSNILVACPAERSIPSPGQGGEFRPAAVPKVMDFGLAKELPDGPASDAARPPRGAVSLSEPGQLLGSLAYMSPEQSRGQHEQVGVRSDVYALGAILYELLSGELPHDMSGAMGDVLQRIASHDPARPSARRPELDSDLDAVVLKALANDPQRRYGTARELAEDMHRWIVHEPVAARTPSIAYQFRKLVRRHPLPFGFAAVLLLSLAGFAVTVAVLALRLDRQRDQAVAALAREAKARDDADAARLQAQYSEEEAVRESNVARAINEFLQTSLASPNPWNREWLSDVPADVSIVDVLAAAANRIEQGALADQPEVEAAVRTTIGQTYLALGRYAEAEPLLRAALEIRECLPDKSHDLVDTLVSLGSLLEHLGRFAESESLVRRALSIMDDPVFATAGTTDHVLAERTDLRAAALIQHGLVLGRMGNPAEGEPAIRQAIDLLTALHGTDHTEVAGAQFSLAKLLHDRGEYAEAEQHLRQALAVRQRILGPHHTTVLIVREQLARTLQARGSFAEAEVLYREVLAEERRILGDEHPRTVDTLNNLGTLLVEDMRPRQAEPVLREALELRRQLLGDEHVKTLGTKSNLGTVLFGLREYEQAASLFLQVADSQRRNLGDDHPEVAAILNNLAYALQLAGRIEESEPHYRESLRISRRAYGDQHPTVAAIINNLAFLRQQQGDFTEAESLYLQALDLRRRALGELHPQVGDALNNLGLLLGARKDHSGAEDYFRQALEVMRRAHPADHADTASTLGWLAMSLQEQGQFSEAEPLLRESLEMHIKVGSDILWRSGMRSALGECLAGQGLYAQAEPVLLACLTELQDDSQAEAEDVREAAFRLVKLYEAWGKPDEAERYAAAAAQATPDSTPD